MKIQASLVIVFALATFALTAEAVPKLGIIGDSMSQATHTHDDCSDPYLDPYDCLEERLGHHDHAYSYTAGTQPWSFRTLLGYSAVVDASKDGDRWAEALGQAMTVIADPEVVDVVVALGHNDVCQGVDHDYAGDLLQIEGYIDDTLTYLTNELASRGGSVFIPDLANIVGMRNVMFNQYRYNHWYEYCQGAWDLSDDGDDIRDDTAEEYCEEHMGLPEFMCDVFGSDEARDLIIDTILLFAQEELEDDRGVCGRVLHSSNTTVERDEAYAFNVALNDLLLRKAKEYDGRNGVDIFISSGLFDIAINKDYMSKIDCFHVNRTGQQIVGTQTWSTMRLPSCHLEGQNCDYRPGDTDRDGDGLANALEVTLGTDPNDPDSDSDGVTDGDEVTWGRNPLVNEAAVLVPLNVIILDE